MAIGIGRGTEAVEDYRELALRRGAERESRKKNTDRWQELFDFHAL